MSAQLDELKEAVRVETDTARACVILIKGLTAKLEEAQTSSDPGALQAVIDEVKATTAELAAAVPANTAADAVDAGAQPTA